ncbi:MAG: OmpH family outer membrane protein [Candidatus Omnitrophica bacterium]|nr:OmpH family outer membrane protein [Candidatus Omnitrophota bacterium]
MKKLAMFICGLVLASFVFTAVALAADKFAYVDLSRTFGDYYKTKDYDKLLTAKENSYTGERDKKVNEFKSLNDKYSLLSDKDKEAKQGELESKAKVIKDFVTQKEGDLRKEQEEKMKEILQDIQNAVKGFSEKEGYTMVFNDRVLVYQNKSMDITDKIIAILNKGKK